MALSSQADNRNTLIKSLNDLLIYWSGHFITKKNEGLIDFRPSDRWIASYPRSGNTWLRFLIGHILHEKPIDYRNINSVIPDTNNIHDGILRKMESPRFLKTHLPYNPKIKKIIYVVRDPRDVAISEYFFLQRRGRIKQINFDNFIIDFCEGNFQSYGNWEENVLSWTSMRNCIPDFHLIKFEDLKQDTFNVLRKIIEFLPVSASENQIENALKWSSLERMKKLEKEQKSKGELIKYVKRKEIPVVRGGRSKEWDKYFSSKSLTVLEEQFGETMEIFGYKRES